MSLKKLNYIGSKHSLLDFIQNTIEEKTGITDFSNASIADVFSGTSSVGHLFRNLNAKVFSNDLEYYAYVIARASICSNYTVRLENLINELNSVDSFIGIIAQNYSEIGADERKFFTIENAKKIDGMRIRLENMRSVITEDEYYFLLASIIVCADAIANVPAIYGSFLKQFKKSAQKEMLLSPIHLKENSCPENRVFNCDCVSMVEQMDPVNIVYLDPPYNERQYGKNYHVLNYIAKYDSEVEIYGKTGLIRNTTLSDWCMKAKAADKLEELMEKLSTKTDWVFMSYNNEGIIPHETIQTIFNKYCETDLVSTNYKRFKNFKYNESGETNEYIWVGRFVN